MITAPALALLLQCRHGGFRYEAYGDAAAATVVVSSEGRTPTVASGRVEDGRLRLDPIWGLASPEPGECAAPAVPSSARPSDDDPGGPAQRVLMCLYFIFGSVDPNDGRTIRELVRDKDAIPLQTHVICRMPAAGAPAAEPMPCESVRFEQRTIPVDPSLPACSV